jgi:hypothetical protein
MVGVNGKRQASHSQGWHGNFGWRGSKEQINALLLRITRRVFQHCILESTLKHLMRRERGRNIETSAVFVGLINHQLAVFFTQNKPSNNNQPTLLFSQKKSALVTRHQPNEQTAK